MKNRLNSAVLWLYEHTTLQGLIFFIQLLVVIGWAVCFRQGNMAAAKTHVTLSWICTFLVLIAGATKFGSTPFFPKFITYDAED